MDWFILIIITLLTNVFNCVYWVFITVNIVLDMTIAISYCLFNSWNWTDLCCLIMLFINFDIIVKNKVSHRTAISQFQLLNPLSPNSDQQQFSPNNIHTLSRDKVMRINKMIIIEKIPWSFIKFSQLIQEMYGDQFGEFVCGYNWGLKG